MEKLFEKLSKVKTGSTKLDDQIIFMESVTDFIRSPITISIKNSLIELKGIKKQQLMKLISAKEAEEMVESTLNNDLEPIMAKIEVAAKTGKKVLHIYNPLSKQVLDTLKDLGYDIPPMPSICSQKDGLYHSIHWA